MPRPVLGSAMAMRSAARHALLPPPLAPCIPGAFHRGRFWPRVPHTSLCRVASYASAPAVGGYLPPLFSVAPMMDWTDNHYRTLARLISRHAWLYTEMVVAEIIVHQKDNLDRFLAFPEEQHPIVLQIGGSNLENLAKATELANAYSYDEINLNCGCPSSKVAGHGCFGARLMFDPEFVGNAMSAIAANCDVPVSIKCRIGVDDRDSYEELCEFSSETFYDEWFISKVISKSPTRHFIIHARKALLSGLSPAENRKVPPLKYEYYYALLRDFPEVQFTLNGGITTIDQVSDSCVVEHAAAAATGLGAGVGKRADAAAGECAAAATGSGAGACVDATSAAAGKRAVADLVPGGVDLAAASVDLGVGPAMGIVGSAVTAAQRSLTAADKGKQVRDYLVLDEITRGLAPAPPPTALMAAPPATSLLGATTQAPTGGGGGGGVRGVPLL
ncbi:hypothetical protein PR202_gb25732 [Eleusine coracana subsp. coracana]|uniref:DUS-like FMN-binding domain-containing protein n=1 Tax=Eleusine coracana subsp. coracana TaxID=191504 RepID=A0AAV5FQR1_ELECO|nr:hypothetical protein PR202_gb25732 [Eleusine coracana subsp. coracana]